MKRALVRVSPPMMAQIMRFPEGTEVVPASGDVYVEFYVEHPDLREQDGINIVNPRYEKSPSGEIGFVDWGQD
jgi:hypothetical protein